MSRYQAPSSGGLFGTGIRPVQTQPDYGSAIDAIGSAFQNTQQGIIHRAMMQQQAALAQRAADREDQQNSLRTAEAASQGIVPIESAKRLIAEQNGPAPEASVIGTTPSMTPMISGGSGSPTPAAPKYSMIDLGNGYAQIPELTHAHIQRELLADRYLYAGNNAQALETTKQGGRIAAIDERGTQNINRDDNKGALTLQQIAARGQTAMSVAQLRASQKKDPAQMSPIQRANLYQKLGQMYVGGANGDIGEAMETAKNDPHLKEFGVTADQLQGYMGKAAMDVETARQKGDENTARSLLTSFAVPDMATAVETAGKLRAATTPSKPTVKAAPQAQPAFDAEANQYKAATEKIKASIADPSARAAALEQAQQIYNSRVRAVAGVK